MTKNSSEDPKGLILESYRIEGITEPECRTIFLDWALSLPLGQDTTAAIAALLARHGAAHPGHPMTGILREGQTGMTVSHRRGGWRSRPRH